MHWKIEYQIQMFCMKIFLTKQSTSEFWNLQYILKQNITRITTFICFPIAYNITDFVHMLILTFPLL